MNISLTRCTCNWLISLCQSCIIHQDSRTGVDTLRGRSYSWNVWHVGELFVISCFVISCFFIPVSAKSSDAAKNLRCSGAWPWVMCILCSLKFDDIRLKSMHSISLERVFVFWQHRLPLAEHHWNLKPDSSLCDRVSTCFPYKTTAAARAILESFLKSWL